MKNPQSNESNNVIIAYKKWIFDINCNLEIGRAAGERQAREGLLSLCESW